MSNPRTLARLEDMWRYAQEAVEITKGKTRQDLDYERLLNRAVVRPKLNYVCDTYNLGRGLAVPNPYIICRIIYSNLYLIGDNLS